MHDKYHVLAKKLKALAEQGIGGEKYNAQRKLASLMKRYNITDTDIQEDVMTQVRFRVKKEQVKIFSYVYFSVTGWERKLARWKKPPYFMVGEVTAIEELEIRAKFDFYWSLYEHNLDMFISAFVYKNHLFPSSSGSSSDRDIPYTSEEKARVRKIIAMMEGIHTVPYLKELKRGT